MRRKLVCLYCAQVAMFRILATSLVLWHQVTVLATDIATTLCIHIIIIYLFLHFSPFGWSHTYGLDNWPITVVVKTMLAQIDYKLNMLFKVHCYSIIVSFKTKTKLCRLGSLLQQSVAAMEVEHQVCNFFLDCDHYSQPHNILYNYVLRLVRVNSGKQYMNILYQKCDC